MQSKQKQGQSGDTNPSNANNISPNSNPNIIANSQQNPQTQDPYQQQTQTQQQPSFVNESYDDEDSEMDASAFVNKHCCFADESLEEIQPALQQDQINLPAQNGNHPQQAADQMEDQSVANGAQQTGQSPQMRSHRTQKSHISANNQPSALDQQIVDQNDIGVDLEQAQEDFLIVRDPPTSSQNNVVVQNQDSHQLQQQTQQDDLEQQNTEVQQEEEDLENHSQDDVDEEEDDSLLSSENFAGAEGDDEGGDSIEEEEEEDDIDREIAAEIYGDLANQHNALQHNDGDDLDAPQDSITNLVPLEFAKSHIAKIEEDMKNMHERHVNLMREMDSNYKMIEKETQEYYIEFLQKWREVAKSKITQYRKQSEQLQTEKEALARERQQAVQGQDRVRLANDELMLEKREQMLRHKEDIERREALIEQMRQGHEESLTKRDKEKILLKGRIEEYEARIDRLQRENEIMAQATSEKQKEHEADVEKINNENESQINDLEANLNKAHEQIQQLKGAVNDLTAQNEKLEQKNQSLQAQLKQKTNQVQIRGTSLAEKIKVGNFATVSGSNNSNQQTAAALQQSGCNSTDGGQKAQLPKRLLVLKNKVQRGGEAGFSVNRQQAAAPSNVMITPSGGKGAEQLVPSGVDNSSSLIQQPQIIKIANQVKQSQQQSQQVTNSAAKATNANQRIEYINQAFDEKIRPMKLKQKQLIEKVNSELKKLRAVQGEQRKGLKTDPFYKDFLLAQQIGDKIKELNLRRKQEIEQAENAQKNSLNSDQKIQQSARGSKSLSPRKQLNLKGLPNPNNNSNSTQENQIKQAAESTNASDIDGLQKKYEAILRENENLKSEISSQQQQLSQMASYRAANSSIGQSVSLLTSQTDSQLTESQIEEKLRKKFQKQVELLESKAHKGILEREEAIQKREKLLRDAKREKDRLSKDMRDILSKKDCSEQEKVQLRDQYEKFKRESKLGEQLLVKHNKELRNERDTIRVKYENETIIRKRLHNQIEDMKGKIRVFCRVRPMSDHENQLGSLPVVTIVDQYTLKIKVKKEGTNGPGGSGLGYKEEEYSFDACFGERSSQEEIFEDTRMLMQSALDGFNVCLFAYGQTGSGKTYTIQGSAESPGIVPRALSELFTLRERYEKSQAYTVSFECYMVELYLDQLHDLFASSEAQQQSQLAGGQKRQKLEIREDPNTGMINITNVQRHEVNSLEQVNDVYEFGIKQRRTASTMMNQDSSRSHFIFSLLVQTMNHQTGQTSQAKISFVDLAGSERVKKSNPTVDQLKEAKAINMSLSALKEVIRQLSQGTQNQFVSYRSNNLTKLMRDSIGGNSKTLMFVNISPADYNSQETNMSLFFGASAKQIKNEVSKNVQSEEVSRLKEELSALKRFLATSGSAPPGNFHDNSSFMSFQQAYGNNNVHVSSGVNQSVVVPKISGSASVDPQKQSNFNMKNSHQNSSTTGGFSVMTRTKTSTQQI